MSQAASPAPRTHADAVSAPSGALTVLHREMVRVRVVSARMVGLQREGKVAFHASPIGAEAPIVAAGLALSDGDALFPGVREWGAALARGLTLESYLRQAVGSRSDTAKGHASPDHPSARSLGIHPASGIAGAHLPQATGWAWAARVRGEPGHARVALAIFGEEITSTGDFHNGLNFAGVFKAPVVFVARVSEESRMDERAVAYGIASARVSGADARATLETITEAVRRAREGKGPSLVCVTTRQATELGDDPLVLPDLGADDPIRAMETSGVIEAGAAAATAAEHARAFDAALASALRDGPPDPATLFEDVYATMPAHLVAQAKQGAVRP